MSPPEPGMVGSPEWFGTLASQSSSQLVSIVGAVLGPYMQIVLFMAAAGIVFTIIKMVRK